MKQKALARQAKVSLRTVERAEASKPIDKPNLRRIVKVLVGEMEESKLAKELYLYRTFDKRCDDVKDWTTVARHFDKQGEHDRAVDCMTTVVDCLDLGKPFHATALVYLTTFYEHLDLFEAAVKAVNAVIDHREKRKRFDDDYYWALYQRGIANRRIAELMRRRTWLLTNAVQQRLDAAREDFLKVIECGLESHCVSARHHLAVVDMHQGKYQEAITSLLECLEDRQRAEGKSPTDYEARTRQAYEHRRLGQCYALLACNENGDEFRNQAKRHFSLASELAAGDVRVRSEIEGDLSAFLD
jgi:tetratricopeptide (TPR) repeat protein